MINHYTPSRGFTLVETLIAITVIMLAIAGPLFAVNQAMNVSRSARDQLVASFLAQEAVEYARFIRDSNYLYIIQNPSSGRSWLFGINGVGGSTNCITAACVVDPLQNTVSRTITPLQITSGGVYTQASSGTVTNFTRTLRLQAVAGSTTEMSLVVRVEWVTRGVPYSLEVREQIHNWL